MTRLAIVKGNNRVENLNKVLRLMDDEITKVIKKKGGDSLFIKINAIDTHFPLAVTRPKALETVIQFFYDRFKHIVIGDNSFVFKKYMESNIYSYLPKEYEKIELTDLTNYGSKEIEFKQSNGGVVIGSVSTLPKEMFSISLSLPKTHDTFVYTGCSKNGMGCVLTKRHYVHGIELKERMLIKRVVKSNVINKINLADVIECTYPDMSILDGFVGMEGNGPLFGTEVPLGIAMASLDSVALDTVMSQLAGFGYVPYLPLCEAKGLGTTKIDEIDIIKEGFNDFREIYTEFKPHSGTNYQLMVELDSMIPKIDYPLFLDVLRRFHRIKDKVFEEMANASR